MCATAPADRGPEGEDGQREGRPVAVGWEIEVFLHTIQ